MCERTCPVCGSTEHHHMYGLSGTYIICGGKYRDPRDAQLRDCGALLANRRDIDAAPTNLTETEAEAWQAAGSGVLIGAEARDPADDAMFGPTRWAIGGTL